MKLKIHPSARRSIIKIWHYTDENWGEKQADRYVRGIYKAIEHAALNRHLWRAVEHEKFAGIFFIRYEHHYIFFRELNKNTLGIVSILHKRMNIPDRLKEELGH